MSRDEPIELRTLRAADACFKSISLIAGGRIGERLSAEERLKMIAAIAEAGNSLPSGVEWIAHAEWLVESVNSEANADRGRRVPPRDLARR